MNQRPALYALAARYRLDAAATGRLYRLAGLGAAPEGLSLRLPRAVAALGAALLGLGLVLWVAANWAGFGRFGQFALLQGTVLTACLGALALPRARAALGLAAFLAIGALFAFFGQTYQTGADPWQLFALWAALALPLALGVRSDLLWAPWVLVGMTAIVLWTQTQAGWGWRAAPDGLGVHLTAWSAAALVAALLTPAARRWTGAGDWALRTAVTLTAGMVTLGALGGLWAEAPRDQFWAGLGVLAAGAAVLALPATFEIAALSAVALGLDTLLVAGLAHRLLWRHLGETLSELLLIGVAAALLLAATLSLILRLARRYGRGGGS